ncbi:MAG: tetratricopeptide repeat protein [Candidatus Gastranaerophilales bacterium]|nr:tetratricopeptide repeat protein [Candidatus Gastranaerophilales bacterium]
MNITKEQKEINAKINKFHKSGNIQRAIETCQLALLNDATNADLHVKLGDLYLEWHLDIYQAKQYVDEAITEYQRALETYMDSSKIYYKIGLAFFYKNELDKSLNYFELAIENDPQMGKAYFMTAEIAKKKAKFQEAIEFAEKAVKVAPFRSSRTHYLIYSMLNIIAFKNNKTKIRSYYELFLSCVTLPFDKDALKEVGKKLSYLKFIPMLVTGLIKAQTAGINQALDIYLKAIEKAPGFVLLYCLIGEIYKTLGRYDDAICEYKMAIWLDSLNITAYRALCQLYEEQGDYDSAIETYLKLIEIQPYMAEYHSNVANILYLKGEIQEAVSHYQNAITLNPSINWTSIIAQTLGYVFQENVKDMDAAIGAYQSAYLLTPKDIDIYINLGSAFYEKGEYDNALTVYRRAIELEPYNAKIHCNLGYLYWGKNELDEAIKAYETAIKYDKTYDIAYNNLGVIYLDDLGRVQKAIELFEEAIKYNPNYALANYNLARSVAITGDKIEAAKLYQIALDLNNITNELDPQEIHDKIQDLFN